MHRQDRGVTLIELMIVVAIVGILATVAVFAYTKYIRRAQSSEVSAMFTEFRLRQEQYQLEIGNGRYLSTGVYWPVDPPAGPNTPTSLAPLPATWNSLRMAPDKTSVFCSYKAVAGTPSTVIGDIEAIAQAAPFNMTIPATNWYYLLAKCDFDSDSTTFSYYFARSDMDGMAVLNSGQ